MSKRGRRRNRVSNVRSLPTKSHMDHLAKHLDLLWKSTKRGSPTQKRLDRVIDRYLKTYDKMEVYRTAKPPQNPKLLTHPRFRKPKIVHSQPFRFPKYLPAVAVATAAAKSTPMSRTAVCVERAQRKEVINALGHAGRVGQKRPIWTAKSRIKCK